MIQPRALLIAFISYCFSSFALAQSLLDAQLPALTQARLSQQQEQVLDAIYPASAVQRVIGRIETRNEIMASGDQQRFTWELSNNHSALDAFNQARHYWSEQGARVLYWCTGRECGPSNLWANQVFKNAKLYGTDDSQAYTLLNLEKAGQDQQIIALYAVTRGNGRGYLYTQQLSLTAPQQGLYPSAATLLKLLREDGKLNFPSLDQGPDERWLALFTQALRQNSTLRVSLQGDAVQKWRDQLIANGIAERRIELIEQQDQVKGLSIILMR